MSGGYFDYQQSHIEYIADKLEALLDEEDIENQFRQETLAEFEATLAMLRICYISVQRIDWLLSADDGEDTFHHRLTDELTKLWKKDEQL